MTVKQPKKPTKKEIKRCFQFVISELVRFNKLLQTDPEAFVKTVKDEGGWFYDLYIPNRGSMQIGKAAVQKLNDMAKNIINSDVRLKGRLSTSELLRHIMKEFGKLLSGPKEIDEAVFIEEIILLAIHEELADREYFIPCHAPNWKGMRTFSIGPVKFWDKDYFLSLHSAELFAHSNLRTADEFYDNYKTHNWIAQISVHGLDIKFSKERAYLCVRLAIAAIKSRMEIFYAQWLGSEKQSMPLPRAVTLTKEIKNGSHPSIILGWEGEFTLNVSNEQMSHLFSHSSAYWFWHFGAFLSHIKDQGEWHFLSQRIITAMLWLDTGNSPVSDAERVVAFSNCLEAMFVTSEKGIAEQIAVHAKKFLDHSGGKPELHDKVKKFYSARCDIVHGSKMPLDPSFRFQEDLGKYLSDVCIEGFLYFSFWLVFRHQKEKTPLHTLPFNKRTSFEGALTTDLPDFIASTKIIETDESV